MLRTLTQPLPEGEEKSLAVLTGRFHACGVMRGRYAAHPHPTSPRGRGEIARGSDLAAIRLRRDTRSLPIAVLTRRCGLLHFSCTASEFPSSTTFSRIAQV